MLTSRRERLRKELRDEILTAARDLFVRNGYESVTMRKVAERVGVAPGTIYHYFDDKDAILATICEETFARLDKRMEALAKDPGGDPLERLRRAGRMYIQFGLDHPERYFLAFALAGHAPKSESVMKAGLRSFDCLRESVRACVDAGLTRTSDVEEIAQSLWACVHGLVMLLIAKPEFPFIEHSRLVDSLLDITMEGIRNGSK
jgi:AcrR family transcriptional regulator